MSKTDIEIEDNDSGKIGEKTDTPPVKPAENATNDEFKPVIFFAQSEKLMIGNAELQKEERFSSGQIADEEAVIRFADHFFTAKTEQEYRVIMRLYPPAIEDGKKIPNRLVMPVTKEFIAKYNEGQYNKRQNIRPGRTSRHVKRAPEPERTADINAQEMVNKLD